MRQDRLLINRPEPLIGELGQVEVIDNPVVIKVAAPIVGDPVLGEEGKVGQVHIPVVVEVGFGIEDDSIPEAG
ncbi:MAG: hypothetical protein GX455_13555 [Phycisphaerae bacterium]|nr:hypothetical protein [Phycisphaerae bacterium]